MVACGHYSQENYEKIDVLRGVVPHLRLDGRQRFIFETTNGKIDSTRELDANRERDDWISITEMLGETLSMPSLEQREQRLVELSSSGDRVLARNAKRALCPVRKVLQLV